MRCADYLTVAINNFKTGTGRRPFGILMSPTLYVEVLKEIMPHGVPEGFIRFRHYDCLVCPDPNITDVEAVDERRYDVIAKGVYTKNHDDEHCKKFYPAKVERT